MQNFQKILFLLEHSDHNPLKLLIIFVCHQHIVLEYVNLILHYLSRMRKTRVQKLLFTQLNHICIYFFVSFIHIFTSTDNRSVTSYLFISSPSFRTHSAASVRSHLIILSLQRLRRSLDFCTLFFFNFSSQRYLLHAHSLSLSLLLPLPFLRVGPQLLLFFSICKFIV